MRRVSFQASTSSDELLRQRLSLRLSDHNMNIAKSTPFSDSSHPTAVGILEELVILELTEDGGRMYHQFTVRELYNHIMTCITNSKLVMNYHTTSIVPSDRSLSPTSFPSSSHNGDNHEDTTATTATHAHSVLPKQLPLPPPQQQQQQQQQQYHHHYHHPRITYRERLGGHLHPRDMRRMVIPFSRSNEPTLIVRRHVMLLNFDPLRAIVLRDRCLILVPNGADQILEELERRLVRNGANRDDGWADDEVEEEAEEEEEEKFTTTTDTALQPEHEEMLHGRLTSASVDSHHRVSNFTTTTTSTMTPRLVEKNHPPLRIMQGLYPSNEGETAFAALGLIHETADLLMDPLISHPNVDGRMDDDDDHDSGGGIIPPEMMEDDDMGQQEMKEIMQDRSWMKLPFELQSLDAVLHSVMELLANQASDIQEDTLEVMERLLDPQMGGGDFAQEMLRTCKNNVNDMASRVQWFMRALNVVLSEDEDMALMNLSRLLTHPHLFVQPVPPEVLEEESDEPELILESYLQLALVLSSELEFIKGQLQTTEEQMNMKSDNIRNKILYINMVITLIMVSLTLMSLVAGYFGMNLPNRLMESSNRWIPITVGTVAGGVAMTCIILLLLRRWGIVYSTV